MAVLVLLAMLWLGIKETSAAMLLVFRMPLVLGGTVGVAGVVWWMGRPAGSEPNDDTR